jgi:hypothetical protein
MWISSLKSFRLRYYVIFTLLSLDFCEYVLEFRVVHLHTVAKIDADHLVGQMVDLFFVGVQLVRLILYLVSFTRSLVPAFTRRFCKSAMAVR